MINPRILATWLSFYEDRDGTDAAIIVQLCREVERLTDSLQMEQRVAALERQRVEADLVANRRIAALEVAVAELRTQTSGGDQP